MRSKRSAGILLYRWHGDTLQVLLGHMGGPFWSKKDAGAWSFPKGEYLDEDPLTVALKEFEEELGSVLPECDLIPLGEQTMPSGKHLSLWAAEGDFDVSSARSNTFSMEWPPRSGKISEFPEIDRAGWFDVDLAREKLSRGQSIFLERLVQLFQEERLRP